MSNISCIEFERLVELAVESRTPVDSAVLRGHAAECVGCRAAWLDATLLDGAVAEWRKTGKKILPSVDLADIVLTRRTSGPEPIVSTEVTPFAMPSSLNPDAGIAADQRDLAVLRVADGPAKTDRSRFPRRAVASAIVAAVAVSVSVFWNRAGRHDDIAAIDHRAGVGVEGAHAGAVQAATLAPPVPSRTEAVTPPTTHQVAEVPAPVEAMVQGAQAAYLDLANEAAQAVTGATALVPRSSLASVMPASRDENDRWVDDVGHQFEPVGKNLSQAFQFIFEAVPADKAPAT
jgi:hypothetical protein